MMSYSTIHPAYSIPFSDLIKGLEEEVDNHNVNKRTLVLGDEDNPKVLTQYTYTQICTYNAAWNLYTQVARGIIVDHERIVALPFPKFFNLSENKTIIPDLPFKCYEKVDGSLIIVFHYDGEWHTATKGSFNSDQAVWADNYLRDRLWQHIDFEIDRPLDTNKTYLFEAIYPQNKIVVNYGNTENLVLLGVYDVNTGLELDIETYKYIFDTAISYNFHDMDAIITKCSTLPKDQEGFVIRWDDGTRGKVKGDEYCRVHKLISNVTPLAIWEMMLHGDNLDFVRKELPEEFLVDFDNIVTLINHKILDTYQKVQWAAYDYLSLTDKDLGLIRHTLDADIRKFIFPYRKNNGQFIGKMREGIYRLHRPTANRLEGYELSYEMKNFCNDGFMYPENRVLLGDMLL